MTIGGAVLKSIIIYLQCKPISKQYSVQHGIQRTYNLSLSASTTTHGMAPVDKSTPVRGKVRTTVSYGKPEQDKARVRDSRYVIKVMNDNTGGGEDPLIQRLYRTFSLVHN